MWNFIKSNVETDIKAATLLKMDEEKSAQVKNGYEMLELQAEENWRIWNS